ncbi:MAG: tRNA pseudouridine(55) synthase TruB [Patescibacteria group bacterium]|jgi:tRNA pseudouridine55 synthase
MLAQKTNQKKIEAILTDEKAGLYLVDKPKSLQSFSIVSKVRKILNTSQVGFSGTLDPLASGLMIVASGQATKLLDLFHILPKEYEADIIFGKSSPSFDLELATTTNESAEKFNQAQLKESITKFTGEQWQQVPIYSAIKVAGQKLHESARRGKKVVAPKKKINIYKIDILQFDYPKAKILVTCSAGTYIRSLVNDLGQDLKTGAVLSDLRRTAIGDLSIKKAAKFDDLDKDKLLGSRVPEEKIRDYLSEYFV